MKILCPKCEMEEYIVVKLSGPHAKAVCAKCNSYIKFLTKEELKHITDEEDNEDLPSSDNLKKYSEQEYENWEEFKKICTVRADNMWIRNECRLISDTCLIQNCFAFQLVKLLRGYF